MDSSGELKKNAEDDNGEFLTFQFELDAYGAFVITADKEDRKMRSAIFAGGSDGSSVSALRLMSRCVATAMAFEGPEMPVDDRAALGKALGVFDGRAFSEGVTIERKGVKYSSSFSEGLGFMLGVYPAP